MATHDAASAYVCSLSRSVLEPGRTLTLAEKGGAGAEVIVAAPAFRLVATMNPGGDYGKKELSPALSNRFTQIWVPAMHDEGELASILASRLPGALHHLAHCSLVFRLQAPRTTSITLMYGVWLYFDAVQRALS